MKTRTSALLDMAKRRAGGALPFGLEDLRRHVEESLAASPRCPYCGLFLFEGNISLDHKIPVKRGGGHGLDNVEYLCVRCNKTKGNLTHEEFAAVIRKLDEAGAECRNPALREKVLSSLLVANSFRIGANRRAKKSCST